MHDAGLMPAREITGRNMMPDAHQLEPFLGGFPALAAEISIRPETQVFSLDQANQALLELKERKIRGAKVPAL